MTIKHTRMLLILLLAALALLAACEPSAPARTVVPTPVAVAPTTPPEAPVSGVTELEVGYGRGFSKGFWQVFFNTPTGSSDAATYVNGIDVHLARALDNAQRTIDIAAFEMDNTVIEEALLRAHARGVTVRVVTDDEHGLHSSSRPSIRNLANAGVPVVDDSRSALMHNKFVIIDSQVVWTGSWNYTINDTYRNDNNAIVLRSQRAVAAYQAEFNEMFEDGQFGPRSPVGPAQFTQDGIPIEIYFAPEDDVVTQILRHLNSASSSIYFMAFSFTLDALADVMLERAMSGVTVEGVYEHVGSRTAFSTLTPLYCAGLDVRSDGNPYRVHHKVIIIDETTVLTGSFNFSSNAATRNDENMVVISDPDLAALYVEEFRRVQAMSGIPTDINCP